MDNPFNSADFRSELSGMFDEKLKSITDLLAKHDSSITKHEAAMQRGRGMMWAVGIIWTALMAAAEWLFHSGKH